MAEAPPKGSASGRPPVALRAVRSPEDLGVTGTEPATAPSPIAAAADALDEGVTPAVFGDEIVSGDGSTKVPISRGRLGAYVIDRAIGKGKFSTVFRATRQEDKAVVALKRIRIFDALDAKSRDKVSLAESMSELIDHGARSVSARSRSSRRFSTPTSFRSTRPLWTRTPRVLTSSCSSSCSSSLRLAT
jgi:hypothetical protein